MEVEDQGGNTPADDPAESFGYRRLPLLPPPTNGNWHSQPTPWLTPSRLREDFPYNEGEDKGGETPAADHLRESHFRVPKMSSSRSIPCRGSNVSDEDNWQDRPEEFL